jgi:hypothetical protein
VEWSRVSGIFEVESCYRAIQITTHSHEAVRLPITNS